MSVCVRSIVRSMVSKVAALRAHVLDQSRCSAIQLSVSELRKARTGHGAEPRDTVREVAMEQTTSINFATVRAQDD